MAFQLKLVEKLKNSTNFFKDEVDVEKGFTQEQKENQLKPFWVKLLHKHQIPRKLFHAGAGLLVMGLFIIGVSALSILRIAVPCLLLMIIVEWIRLKNPEINKTFVKLAGILMRKNEAKEFNSTVYFLAGVVFCLLFYNRFIAATSLLVLSFADPAAFIAGKSLGHFGPRLPFDEKKTIIGSLGCALTGGLVVSIMTLIHFGLGYLSLIQWLSLFVFSGLSSAVAEAIAIPHVDDNFSMPVISGFCFSVVFWTLGIAV
eukprot:gb/GECH01003118.1/.p1 GENE.gb/GECH01003118.1/~~gb/GECH01003118.1/.p1  ORF type:complete len:258 (+),score=44.82 gb/GECH01003118.1/:1-774(+)